MGVSEAPRRPLVIAHRGASGERPEHTMGAYRLAIAQGADFIEPDLVMTRDGVLVCRHENEISGTTDVAERAEFADRRTEKVVDGVTATGWWTEDFTLEELKTLRCMERLPQLRPANTAYDGQEEIPTFAEVLALAQEAGVGVYPELKHPSYFYEIFRYPAQALLRDLDQVGWREAGDRVFVQCFEVRELQRLGQMAPGLTRIQLMSAEGGPWDKHAEGVRYADMLSDAGLTEIAGYAHGIGVEKSLVRTRGGLVVAAHDAGLLVHAWTFRAENYFLPEALRRGDSSAPDYLRQHGDLREELMGFYEAGIDGVFTDFPALAPSGQAFSDWVEQERY